ncbi:MAG: cupin domain-containing protein [Pleomorphochaeta sp.]
MKSFFYNHDIAAETVGKGITRKVLAHNKELMVCEIEFKKGSIGVLHKHFHSQCSYIVSGVFEFEIDGVKKILKAGDSTYKQPDVMHGCVCLETGKLIDIFTPMREDFINDK